MENTTLPNMANPLTKYFRQPAIHMKLPSNGSYWPDNSLNLPITGEIPVYPMTTRDEITLRTPDALMNGSGVVEIIQSCCPNIKNAWDTPSIDVDAILIGIRLASYGNSLDVETKCPACGEDNAHSLDLQICLGSIKAPKYTKLIEINGLKIKLKPVPYFGSNKQNSIEFEEQKMLQALERANLDENARNKQIYESVQRLIQITTETITASTEYIELDDGIKVRDSHHILEFYANAPASLVKQIQTKLSEYNVDAGIKPQTVSCNSCTHAYQVPVVFDYSSFFGKGF
jgi:hypothetical protein